MQADDKKQIQFFFQRLIAETHSDSLKERLPFVPRRVPLCEERPASVLVGMQRHDRGWQLLLTKRTGHLRAHKGELAFPGGVADAGEDVTTTALRELEEELGISSSFVQVVGAMPQRRSSTGYMITPILGLFTGNPDWRLNHAEVAAAFWVPLAFLANMENTQSDKERLAYHGHTARNMLRWPLLDQDVDIWGVTADIILTLVFAWEHAIQN